MTNKFCYRVALIAIVLWFSTLQVFSQTNQPKHLGLIEGYVYYHNSDSTPAVNLDISSEDIYVTTNTDGYFEIKYPHIPIGETVKLMVGRIENNRLFDGKEEEIIVVDPIEKIVIPNLHSSKYQPELIYIANKKDWENHLNLIVKTIDNCVKNKTSELELELFELKLKFSEQSDTIIKLISEIEKYKELTSEEAIYKRAIEVVKINEDIASQRKINYKKALLSGATLEDARLLLESEKVEEELPIDLIQTRDKIDLLFLNAENLLSQNKITEAIEAYTTLAEIYNSNKDFLNFDHILGVLFKLCLNFNDPYSKDQMIALSEMGISLNANNSSEYSNLFNLVFYEKKALGLYYSNRYEEAITNYEFAIHFHNLFITNRTESDDFTIYTFLINLSVCHLKLGDSKKAKEVLRSAWDEFHLQLSNEMSENLFLYLAMVDVHESVTKKSKKELMKSLILLNSGGYIDYSSFLTEYFDDVVVPHLHSSQFFENIDKINTEAQIKYPGFAIDMTNLIFLSKAKIAHHYDRIHEAANYYRKAVTYCKQEFLKEYTHELFVTISDIRNNYDLQQNLYFYSELDVSVLNKEFSEDIIYLIDYYKKHIPKEWDEIREILMVNGNNYDVFDCDLVMEDIFNCALDYLEKLQSSDSYWHHIKDGNSVKQLLEVIQKNILEIKERDMVEFQNRLDKVSVYFMNL